MNETLMLTTVHQPIYRIGKRMCEMLIRLIRASSWPPAR